MPRVALQSSFLIGNEKLWNVKNMFKVSSFFRTSREIRSTSRSNTVLWPQPKAGKLNPLEEVEMFMQQSRDLLRVEISCDAIRKPC